MSDPVVVTKKKKRGYLGRAWNAVKYYSQTSYYLAYVYGRMRGYAQPWISTEFNVHQIEDEGHVFIGDIASAYNKEKLKELGITHIITAILGVQAQFPEDFVYLTVPVRDVESEEISKYLPQTTDFIRDAVAGGGKVLVHCVCGVSRSATIVAAWLMSKDGYTAEQAIKYLQSRRGCVDPNPAFRNQLLDLEPDKDNRIPSKAFDDAFLEAEFVLPDDLPPLPLSIVNYEP